MSPYIAKSSVVTVWLAAIATSLSMAVGTSSLVAWMAAALIGRMPPLMFDMLAQRPVKTTAEILREAETGKPL